MGIFQWLNNLYGISMATSCKCFLNTHLAWCLWWTWVSRRGKHKCSSVYCRLLRIAAAIATFIVLLFVLDGNITDQVKIFILVLEKHILLTNRRPVEKNADVLYIILTSEVIMWYVTCFGCFRSGFYVAFPMVLNSKM